FRVVLEVRNIEYRVPLRDKVYSDDFLITADRSPNSRGAETLELGGDGCEALLEACGKGQIHFLYICQHDLTQGFDEDLVARALSQVRFVAYHGSRENRTGALANVQLPAAVYAEKDGTFTNIQGRVQRIRRAVAPLGQSLPDLEILELVARDLGLEVQPGSPGEIFLQLAEQVPAFRGMSYESIGDLGQPMHPFGS